ncbi:hypothetical protein [Micromonospora sp. NPDC047738]|uniref:hypothetical protein n=1 Tax=unclassified Micromonospora TaxID=2617518 RepID=UPI0033CBDAA6
MISNIDSAGPTTDPTDTRADARGRTTLRRLGAGALIGGPVLFLAGMLTCPPQASESTADYVTSLARDSGQTQLSAILLHYGTLISALGLLAVPGLVRGARGRAITLVGTLLAAVSLLNISGAVKDDWWRMEIGQRLPLEVAVRISDAVDGASLMPLWRGTSMFAQLGLLLICVGLARAGVVGWWLTFAFVGTFAAVMFIPVHLTLVLGAVFSLLLLPLVVAGVRIAGRERGSVA